MHRCTKSIISSAAFTDLVVDLIVKEDEWLNEAQAERKWEIFVKRADVHERRMRLWMEDVFRRQQADTLANMATTPNRGLRGWLSANQPVNAGVIAKDVIDAWVFPLDEWVERMETVSGVYLTDAMVETGQAELIDLVSDATFNVADPRAQAFINNRTFKFSTDVNVATQDALRASLSEGLATGEGMPALRNRVIDVFTDGYGALNVRASKVRADMIARSEIIRASNAGAELAYMQSGVVEAKQWYSALTERTCFPKSTLVKTADGERPIQVIRKGDLVLSDVGYQKVTDTMSRMYEKRLYGITYADRCLEATGDHPILERYRGWVKMQDLKPGNEVDSVSMGWHTITGTYKQYRASKAAQCVYNLEVAGGHTYFANGILVHNCPWCLDMHEKTMGLGIPFFEQGDTMTVDDKTIKLDYEEVRYPPLHPRCLCTLLPVVFDVTGR